jgi:ribulose 1,5-bisphosphate synthetase/thiazole synthase
LSPSDRDLRDAETSNCFATYTAKKGDELKMSKVEQYDVLVLGSGTGGKLLSWALAREGKRTAVVERKYIGGSCPNVACLPSKNVIHSANVAWLVKNHQEFGIQTGPISIDMAGVYAMHENATWWTISSESILINIRHPASS